MVVATYREIDHIKMLVTDTQVITGMMLVEQKTQVVMEVTHTDLVEVHTTTTVH